jgi:hypothetical protein
MRALPSLVLVFVAAVSLGIVTATAQTQQPAQGIPAPPPNLFQLVLDYVALAYNWLINIIQGVLQSTLLRQDPQLANEYANIVAWLVSITALYIVLTFAEVLRKFIGYAIALGWAFLLFFMFLAR